MPTGPIDRSPAVLEACRLLILLLMSGLFVSSSLAQTLDPLLEELKAQGRWQEAADFLETRLQRTPGSDNALSIAHWTLELARARQRLFEHDSAELLTREALELLLDSVGEKHDGTASCQLELAKQLRVSGQHQESRVLVEQSLQTRSELLGPHHQETLEAFEELVVLLEEMGLFGEAVSFSQDYARLTESVFGSRHPKTLAAWRGLGSIHSQLGHSDEAETYLEKALRFQRNINDDPAGLVQSLNDLARHYRRAGKREQSLVLLEEALAILEASPEPHPAVLASVVNHIGMVHRHMGRLEKSICFQERSLAIREKSFGPRHLLTSIGLNNLGVALMSQDLERAEKMLSQAASIRMEILGENHPRTLKTLYNLASVRFELGRFDEALDIELRVLEAREETLSGLFSGTSEKQRLAFQDSVLPYNHLTTWVNHPAMTDQVCPHLARLVLRRKGLVVDSLLEDKRRTELLGSGEGERLKQKQRRLSNLLLSMPASDSPELPVWEARREELVSDVERLQKELSDQYLSKRDDLLVTRRQVEQSLAPGTVLIDFLRYQPDQHAFLGKDEYGAILIGPNRDPVWVRLGPAKEIDEAIRDYRASTQSRSRLGPPLRRLHNLIWSPIEEKLPPDTQRVIISPDSELNFVSFAVLLSPKQRFLIEDYHVAYVSSGRDLTLRNTSRKTQSAVLFGNIDFGRKVPGPGSLRFESLPGTKNECLSIRELLEQDGLPVRFFERGEASEDTLRQIQNPGILHLATHGFFLSSKSPDAARLQNPMHRSGVALAGAQTTLGKRRSGSSPNPDNDGFLTAEEVSLLELGNTWLVTLSACNTGRGEAIPGEGVMGLRRGFHMAGVINLVMTLWTVDDEATAELMGDFYRAALSSEPHRALSQTQREWLRQLKAERGIDEAAFIVGPFVCTFRGPVQ